MTTRYVTGDPVVLSNTFTVGGTPTDPTTVQLEVTGPDGTTDTYTYAAAEITRTSAGVYTKTITTDEAGTWLYVWTGTGAAADVEDGTFEVYPVATVDSLDLLTFGEALDALQIDRDGTTTNHDQIRQWLTAVSRRIDVLCGPVVQRTVTSELHDGGRARVFLDLPAASITTLVEYDSTTSTTLTAETNSTKPADGFLLETVGGLSWVWRRAAGVDGTFPAGRRNVDVTYVSGRYTSTETVDPTFKLAAGAILRRLWHRDAGAWARGGDPFLDVGTGGAGFFRVVDPMVREWLSDEVRTAGVA